MAGFGSIEAIETVRHPEFPQLTHVLIHAGDGLSGLGETFYHPDAVEAHVHAELAPRLVGAPAGNIAELWQRMGDPADGRRPYSGTHLGRLGRHVGAGPGRLGPARPGARPAAARGARRPRARRDPRVRDHRRSRPPASARRPAPRARRGDDWGLGGTRESAHRDWTSSLERPGELARELVDEGFTAVKLFPFVRLAEATGGLSITPAQLAENLEPFRAVREAVGDRLDLAVDLVNMWTLAPALQIARALSDVRAHVARGSAAHLRARIHRAA